MTNLKFYFYKFIYFISSYFCKFISLIILCYFSLSYHFHNSIHKLIDLIHPFSVSAKKFFLILLICVINFFLTFYNIYSLYTYLWDYKFTRLSFRNKVLVTMFLFFLLLFLYYLFLVHCTDFFEVSVCRACVDPRVDYFTPPTIE